MISAPDRRETLQLIEDAVAAGARRAQACAELGRTGPVAAQPAALAALPGGSASFGTTS